MFTVLLTRPQHDSAILAATLAERGIASIISPVITIKPHAVNTTDSFIDAIILTSRHALHATAGMDAPCYVVGEQTAREAQKHGMYVAGQATTAEELIPLLPTNKTYFYPSGLHTSHDFSHLTVKREIAYSAEANTTLSETALRAFREHQLNGVALFSARSASLLCELIIQYDLRDQLEAVTAFCLSDKVASRCNHLPWKHISIASSPTQQAMIALLEQAQQSHWKKER